MAAAETDTGSTRDRLLAAGLRLFAERGFERVGVGDVEAAVGLVPRRGALYRHFASKDELLEEAVRRYLDSADQARDEFTGGDGEIVDKAALLGRRILKEMDAQHDITRILERDGDRLPTLREAFRTRVSDAGYGVIAEVLRSWVAQAAPDLEVDLDATAVLLTGALVNARRSAWTFQHPPAGQDDGALVAAWALLCDAAIRDLVRRSRPSGRSG